MYMHCSIAAYMFTKANHQLQLVRIHPLFYVLPRISCLDWTEVQSRSSALICAVV